MSRLSRNGRSERLQAIRVGIDRARHETPACGVFRRCSELVGAIPRDVGLESRYETLEIDLGKAVAVVASGGAEGDDDADAVGLADSAGGGCGGHDQCVAA